MVGFFCSLCFFEGDGTEFGKIVRKGWRSIWKVKYELIDENKHCHFSIIEENVWVKVMDSLLGQIPILNMFTGYVFNPSYIVKDAQDKPYFRMKTLPSFLGRNFELFKLGVLDSDDDDRIMLGLMMMILLERRRG